MSIQNKLSSDPYYGLGKKRGMRCTCGGLITSTHCLKCSLEIMAKADRLAKAINSSKEKVQSHVKV